MSRARNIKPGFFKNDQLAECSPCTRLLFVGLWCEADREGRLEYRPRRIKASCMPYDNVDVEDSVAELAERGFLIIYEISNVQFIQIRNWAKHQTPHHKEVASTIAAPHVQIDTVCFGYAPLNNAIRNRIYARDGRTCKSCATQRGLSIDHIIPVSFGGNSNDENLQVLCLSCNARKGNKILGQVMHESCMNHASTLDESCGSLLVPLIPDSLIPDSLEQALPTPQDSQISSVDENGVVCVDQLQASGIKVSATSALTMPLRQRGKIIPPTHPDVIAAAAEGVSPQAVVDLIDQYPDKPAVYLIATARRQHAEGPRSNQARAGPPQRQSKTLQAIESLNQVILDEDGNPTYRPPGMAARRDTPGNATAALSGPGGSTSG